MKKFIVSALVLISLFSVGFAYQQTFKDAALLDSVYTKIDRMSVTSPTKLETIQ